MHAIGLGDVNAEFGTTGDLLVPDNAVGRPTRMHGAAVAQHHGHTPFGDSALPHAHLCMVSERKIARRLTEIRWALHGFISLSLTTHTQRKACQLLFERILNLYNSL